MSCDVFLESSDNVLVTRVRDRNGNPVLDGVLNLIMLDAQTREVVPGETWPLPYTHVGEGVYEVQVLAAVQIVRGRSYVGQITMTSASSGAGYSEVAIKCEVG